MNAPPAAIPVRQLDRIAAAIRAGDLAMARKTHDNLPAPKQKSARAQVLLATILHRSGETEQALKILETVKSARQIGRAALIDRASLCRQMGDHAGYHDTLAQLCAAAPDSPSLLFKLGQSFVRRHEPDEAARIAVRLAGLGDRPDLLVRLRFDIALSALEMPGIIAAFDMMLQAKADLPDIPQIFVTLQELPEPDRSRIATALWQQFPPLRPKLEKQLGVRLRFANAPEPVADILADAPPGVPRPGSFRRALVTDDGADVLQSAPGTSGITVVAFAGLADRWMVPLEWLDAFCAAHNHSAIYLRDASRTMFMRGVSALGPDLDATIEALRGLLAHHRTRTLICLGISGGGFAAIRYGLRLGAERVLAASPPTNLRVVDDDRARLLLHRWYQEFGRDAFDVTPDIIAGGGKTRVIAWYGDAVPMDRQHAGCLQGLPGVTLRPIAGYDSHMTMGPIIENGALAEFLAP